MNNESGFDVSIEESLKCCKFDWLGDGQNLSSNLLILAQCCTPRSLVSKMGLFVQGNFKGCFAVTANAAGYFKSFGKSCTQRNWPIFTRIIAYPSKPFRKSRLNPHIQLNFIDIDSTFMLMHFCALYRASSGENGQFPKQNFLMCPKSKKS